MDRLTNNHFDECFETEEEKAAAAKLFAIVDEVKAFRKRVGKGDGSNERFMLEMREATGLSVNELNEMLAVEVYAYARALLRKRESDYPQSNTAENNSNLTLVTIPKQELRKLTKITEQGMTKRYKNGDKWGYFNITETTVDITETAYLALKKARSLRT